MSGDIVNAILIKNSVDKLTKEVKKFNKSSFWLTLALIALTLVMVIEVGIQIGWW